MDVWGINGRLCRLSSEWKGINIHKESKVLAEQNSAVAAVAEVFVVAAVAAGATRTAPPERCILLLVKAGR